MHEVILKHNPYTKQTTLWVDGEDWENTALLRQDIGKERLQVWLDAFPGRLAQELNTKEPIALTFHGIPQDCEDVESCFRHMEGFRVKVEPSKAASPELKSEALFELLAELQDGPFTEFRDPIFLQRFELELSSRFEIGVVATMSSGKSTLINALMGKNLLPASNEATTASITRVWHDPEVQEGFLARSAATEDALQDATFVPASRQLLEDWNSSPEQHMFVELRGSLPMLEGCTSKLHLVLTDTPGVNSSINAQHKECTMQLLEGQDQSMILHVLNGQQLGVKDDADLLDDIRRAMRLGGRQGHDRFLFVLNQMDTIDPDNGEEVSRFVKNAEAYLADHEIQHPVYVCASALVARVLRCPEATRKERRYTEDFMGDSHEDEALQLHRYTNASRWVCQDVALQLEQSRSATDAALVYSGIPTIESIIREYLYKHALPMKISSAYDILQHKFDEINNIAEIELKCCSCREERLKIAEEIAYIKARQHDRVFLEKGICILKEKSLSEYQCYADMMGRVDNILKEFDEALKSFPTVVYSYSDMRDKENELHDVVQKSYKNITHEFREAFKKIQDTCQEYILSYYFDYIERIGCGASSACKFLGNIKSEFKIELDIKMRYVNVCYRKERECIGIEEKSKSKWYNPFSWFRKITIPVYKDKHIYELENAIMNIKNKYIKEVSEIKEAFDHDARRAIGDIIREAERAIEGADRYMRNQFDTIEKLSKRSKDMQKHIDDLECRIHWLKMMNSRVSSFLKTEL